MAVTKRTLTPQPSWLIIAQAAERASCSTRTIHRAIAAGELDAGHSGGLVRIRPEAVDAWLERDA